MPGKPKDEDAEYISLQTTADLFEVSTWTVRRWVSSGQLPAYRLGEGSNLLRVKRSDAEALLHRVPTAGQDGAA
jgi:excisionase family DNA binding protein